MADVSGEVARATKSQKRDERLAEERKARVGGHPKGRDIKRSRVPLGDWSLRTTRRIEVALVLIVGVILASLALFAFVGTVPSNGLPTVTVGLSPAVPLTEPGQTQYYASIVLRSASSFTGQLALATRARAGIALLPNETIFSMSSGSISIPAVLQAAATAFPGIYPVALSVSSNGVLLVNTTVDVRVVSTLVVLHALAFQPQNITVSRGTTVWWINLDSTIGCCDPGYHNISLSGLNVVSPTLKRLDVWSYQFDTTGVFSYYCTIHTYMKGVVVVV